MTESLCSAPETNTTFKSTILQLIKKNSSVSPPPFRSILGKKS